MLKIIILILFSGEEKQIQSGKTGNENKINFNNIGNIITGIEKNLKHEINLN
jgi:hypothetical protein